MKKKRIGLALGGGGGMGAYQVGVMKAIFEYGLDKQIVAVAGTSIGALNMLTFSSDLNAIEKVWDNLSRKVVLTKPQKRSWKNFSLYSREGMQKIISQEIDFERLKNIETPKMYAVATKQRDKTAKKFLINGRSKEEVMKILEASSAIPFIFEKTTFEGEKYYDGALTNNLPIDLLIERENCDLIFAIPLTGLHQPNENSYPNVTIINFKEDNYDEIFIWRGMLGFESTLAKKRIERGYQVGKDLISYLDRQGLIDDIEITDKKYFSLDDIEEYRLTFQKKKYRILRTYHKYLNKVLKK